MARGPDTRAEGRAFVRLLLMTACREMEAADISVGEIVLADALRLLPASRTKNGQPHAMPLHQLVMADLQAIWPAHDAHTDFRLLGAIKGNGLRGFSVVKVRLDRASGVTGWRFHDLRRTARTAMRRLGVDRDAAEAALDRISNRTPLERVYDRSDPRERAIAALQRWQAFLAALIGAEPTAEIIPLRSTA